MEGYFAKCAARQNVQPEYHVEFYESEDGTCPAEVFVNSLDDKMSAKIYRVLGMLEKNGPDLRGPYSKHLDDGIFEARARIGSDITRVLFFFYVDKRIIATHGFMKKTQKTPPAEIARAKSHRTAFIEKEARKHENA